MKRVNTESVKVQVNVNGLMVQAWEKTCPVCHKRYTTTSRSQKFCSDECCKKGQKRRRKQQKEYNDSIQVQRLSARAHALAVSTVKELIRLKLIENECAVCKATGNLHVHHINKRWLDNTPENLLLLCNSCHSKVHSELDKKPMECPEIELSIYNQILK